MYDNESCHPLSSKKIPEYNEKAVAFLDILGFRELINRIDGDTNLHIDLNHAMQGINTAKNEPIYLDAPMPYMENFSDSIVMISDINHIRTIVKHSMLFTLRLLKLGFLVRGGITFGKMHFGNGVLYGSGLVRAYELESKIAKYPRIIIDDNAMHKLENDAGLNSTGFGPLIYPCIGNGLSKGDNGFAFIDYLDNFWKIYRGEICNDQEMDFFNIIRNGICAAMPEGLEDKRVIEKHNWTRNYFNSKLNGINVAQIPLIPIRKYGDCFQLLRTFLHRHSPPQDK